VAFFFSLRINALRKPLRFDDDESAAFGSFLAEPFTNPGAAAELFSGGS
jgi:hypothetical protein